MFVVKKLKKSSTVNTVKDVSTLFNSQLMNMTYSYDEIILAFDTYKPDSLKKTTREKRQQGQDPIRYQVSDDTNIKHISMSRFLSHEQTKADLTEYLAEKTLEYNKDSSKVIIVSAAGHSRSNRNLHFDDNNHEEADTLMICLAINASQRSPSSAEITIFSPDTDVLVLAIANYHLLASTTSVSLVSGIVQIRPMWFALGEERAKALSAFHAFTGADNIGRFSGIGKKTWFKAFLNAESNSIYALKKLLESNEVTEDMLTELAAFVCSVYCPKGFNIESIPELRWHLFCKHMAESTKLPPTLGALKQHTLRVHVQCNVWGQCDVFHQEFLDPLQNGFYKEPSGEVKPVTTDVLPAPKAIIEMVRCRCTTNCSSKRCSCRAASLSCTDLCNCDSDQCENDDDYYTASQQESDDENDDEFI